MWPGIVSQGDDIVFAADVTSRRLVGPGFTFDEFAAHHDRALNLFSFGQTHAIAQDTAMNSRLLADRHVVPKNRLAGRRGGSNRAVFSRDVLLPTLLQHLDADV